MPHDPECVSRGRSPGRGRNINKLATRQRMRQWGDAAHPRPLHRFWPVNCSPSPEGWCVRERNMLLTRGFPPSRMAGAMTLGTSWERGARNGGLTGLVALLPCSDLFVALLRPLWCEPGFLSVLAAAPCRTGPSELGVPADCSRGVTAPAQPSAPGLLRVAPPPRGLSAIPSTCCKPTGRSFVGGPRRNRQPTSPTAPGPPSRAAPM